MSPKPPAELARLQAAFGRSISTPFEFLDEQNNYALRYSDYDRIAVDAVCPRGSQSAAERVGVYNQQYWFRLLTIMQEEFPLTEALLRSEPFNRFAMSYLDAEPPDSVRLRDLSNRLQSFAASADIPAFVREAIALERIYIESFDAATLPLPTDEDGERLVMEALRFQPHFALLECRFNVVGLRRRLKSGETVSAADVAESVGCWAFWRAHGIQSIELGRLQAQLLRRLIDGEPLGEACEALAEELAPDDVEFLVTHVQRWFAVWANQGWFARPVDL